MDGQICICLPPPCSIAIARNNRSRLRNNTSYIRYTCTAIHCTDSFDNTNYNYCTGLVENKVLELQGFRQRVLSTGAPHSSPPLTRPPMQNMTICTLCVRPLVPWLPTKPLNTLAAHLWCVHPFDNTFLDAFSESKQVTVEFGSDILDSERKGHRDDVKEEYETQ